MDYGHALDSEGMRERFWPWFHAIDVVSNRLPSPEAMAKMAILLRACGLTDASLAVCDRADSVERIMMTEVVRAGTWRKLGKPDLADVRAEQGDFAAAVQLVDQGTTYARTEPTLRAAGAAYRARLTGSPADLSELIELASNLPARRTAYGSSS
jgi:hypothetical protein